MIGLISLFVILVIFIYAGIIFIMSAATCAILYVFIKFIQHFINKYRGG